MNVWQWMLMMSAVFTEVLCRAAPMENSDEDICPSICSLQKFTGPCKSTEERFYHNIEKGECERFLYGGCDGNDNNFMTIEDCQNRCVGPPPVDICSLPPVFPTSENCIASLLKWTYDQAQEKCISYDYGGCGGTDNLFDTEKQCQSSCDLDSLDVCERPPVVPTSQVCFGSIPSWTYDATQEKCIPYEYGGCGGTDNLFDTEKQCQSSCDLDSLDVCERPPVLPTSQACTASIASWTYNSTQQKCISYEFGGCGETENLFFTEKACKSSCDLDSLDVCELPPVFPTSPACFGSIPSWTYDQGRGMCVPYDYGGCGATDNLFNTEEQCRASCDSASPF